MRLPAFIEGSLRRKVLALVLMITVIALVLSAAALSVYDLRIYERTRSADLIAQAQVLARASGPAVSFGDEATANKDLAVLQVRPGIEAAALYTRDGRLFSRYARAGQAVQFPASPGREGYRIEGSWIDVFQPVVENGEAIGTIFLRARYAPLERLRDYLSILLVVSVASVAVAALLSRWLQRAVTEPILDMAEVSRHVTEERDYSQRARKTTGDEIGQLVDAYNTMLAEIGRRSVELREADQRKDEFLATLAHELRNPLAPIRNALEILRLGGGESASGAKAREMMARQVDQMVRLVDDLLDVSRITTGKLAVRKAVIELDAAVRDAVEISRPVIEARRHTLEVRVPDAPVVVEGDRTRLAQVFSNLLNNAAKYTDPGGHIVLTLTAAQGEAEVRVRDNGIGLEPAMLERIFDMFMQVDRSLERAQAGLGVGLTLAKRLVELHDGRIEAHSAGKGQGTEFVVRLPMSRARVDRRRVPAAARGTGPSRRILLADDNADFADSLGQILAGLGHDVRIVNDGAAAVVAADEFLPDVAILDIGMPKVHGYDVARHIRHHDATSHCLLVAVTGWGQEADRRRSREAGFDRHLVKPVDPEELEGILADAAISD